MSLRLRLLAAFAYVLVLILVALEVPLGLNLARRIDAEVRNDAASQAFVVAAGASGRMSSPNALAGLARTSARDLGARVIIVNKTGRVLADSSGAVTRPVSYASRPEIRVALHGQRAQGERHSDTLRTNLLYTAVPVTDKGRTVGAVRVTQSVAEVDRRIRRAVLVLIGIGALALALGLGLAWFLAGTLSRPLRNLASTARRVEEGDLDARAETEGPREHREVAHAFNDMTERLGVVLAAQREFVANASHQLRTPLTGLRLRIEAARANAGDVSAELEAAEQELDRLAGLLAALLTLAREGSDEPSPQRVPLADAAIGAHERWAGRAARDGRDLVLAGDDDATAAASDEDVAIVLDNLIENALTYSPAGDVTVEWGRDDGEVWLAVLDEGPGVAPGEEREVFERFARGRAGRGGPAGTGLGLAIVRTLAARWGGGASIRNRPEGGVRVEVRFPAAGPLRNPQERLDNALPRPG